ncbi:MAG: DNA-processing protein DprA [Deltaproteobacteria bacterium]|nr:DNA-processing protein DprA [Deltaproteobacteria bacterium]
MENILPWLVLRSVPGIGNLLFKRLLDRFETPTRAMQAEEEDLCRIDGMSQRLARSIHRHRTPDWVHDELDLASRKGYRIVTLRDPDYPALLREIPDPPPFLYVCGDLGRAGDCISMVGSRNATDYGLQTTLRLSRDLAAQGMTIVSGMALGIDTAAHRGALAGKGITVAVLGSGLEKIYPPENRGLFHDIAGHGAVISEFPLRADPEGHHFPMRNRVISGMSLGTVVVEATLRSGSLITARLAAEQNREVFAVPGSVSSFKSTGTHTLIKQGAKLVEQARDVTEEFTHLFNDLKTDIKATGDEQTPEAPFLSADERTVFDVLDSYPVHIDVLAAKTGVAVGKLTGILLSLELKGVVQRSPGNLFSLKP